MVDPIGKIESPDVLIVIHNVVCILLLYTSVPMGRNPL
jgi:hypothetical protein